jgi:hypothetical protein
MLFCAYGNNFRPLPRATIHLMHPATNAFDNDASVAVSRRLFGLGYRLSMRKRILVAPRSSTGR